MANEEYHPEYGAVFSIEVDKIKPNPYQPRREFDEARLRELADSIRHYGVLQPLVISRIETFGEDGGMVVEYELIAGERRLRASKLAGLKMVPAIIRKEEDPMLKLELAIIENLQREDLNSVDRARAFMQLHEEFGFSHKEIGKKVGKSREYVSNTLRILLMPQEIIDGLVKKQISEGHTRPLLMLSDRPDEQMVLFKEIVYKKITVRQAEQIARQVAKERARKHDIMLDPETEARLSDLQSALGTRIRIVKKEKGGNISIDFFSEDDIKGIFAYLTGVGKPASDSNERLANFLEKKEGEVPEYLSRVNNGEVVNELHVSPSIDEDPDFLDDSSSEEAESFEKEDLGTQEAIAKVIEEEQKKEDEEDLYSVTNFSL